MEIKYDKKDVQDALAQAKARLQRRVRNSLYCLGNVEEMKYINKDLRATKANIKALEKILAQYDKPVKKVSKKVTKK